MYRGWRRRYWGPRPYWGLWRRPFWGFGFPGCGCLLLLLGMLALCWFGSGFFRFPLFFYYR